MGRLNGININNRRWLSEITYEGKRTNTYKLTDKRSGYSYSFLFVKGLEQLHEDNFLVFRGADYDNAKFKNEIIRYELLPGCDDRTKVTFKKEVSDFMYLTDDLILFKQMHFDDDTDILERRTDDGGKEYFAGVYSITANKMLKKADWITELQLEVGDYSEVNHELLLIKRIDEINIVSITVDTKDFSIKSCYHPLADKHIELKNPYILKGMLKEMPGHFEIIKKQYPMAEQDYMEKRAREIIDSENQEKPRDGEGNPVKVYK